MVKQLIIILFAVLCFANIFAAEDKVESGDKSTDILKRMHTFIKYSKSPLKHINALEKEAIKQENQLYIAYAYREKIYFYSKQSETDSVKHYLNRLSDQLDILDSTQDLSEYDRDQIEAIKITAITNKYDIYINENKYDIVLIEVEKMLKKSKGNKSPRLESEAYILLGTTHLYTKNLPESIKCFRIALDINEQLMIDSPKNNYNFYRAMEGLSIAYGGSEKYNEALQISDSLINRIEETHKYMEDTYSDYPDNNFFYNYYKSKAYCFYSLWNTKTNHTKEAREQLDSIKKFIKDHYDTSSTPASLHMYDYAETIYWQAMKDYKKAKEYAQTMADNSCLKNNMFTYMLAHIELAKIMNAQGNCQEAYTLMAKIYWQNDSISAMNFSKQIAEMQTIYKLDKAKMIALQTQKELDIVKNRLLISLLIIILCTAIALLIWQNRRKIVKKNIQLYNQYIEIKNRNKEIATLQQGLIKQNEQKNDDSNDTNNILITKLDEYLQETKCFLNPDLTREELAIQIGTNRQYLIEAIKEKTGKTFNEYIYSFRLDYAHEQIINDRKKPISDILLEAGFQTRATFIKSFKDVYGLTPSELRRILN